MNRLQTKTLSLLALTLTPLLAGAFYTHSLLTRSQNLQQEMALSLQLKESLQSRWEQALPLEPEESVALKRVRQRLQPPERAQALSQMIGALGSSNPSLMKARWQEFSARETEFYNQSQEAFQALHKRLEHVMLISLLAASLMAALTMGYLRRFIFRPLADLSSKMLEFLTDQYSFRFFLPDNTEIGDLQRTFNSLAQKVINHVDELKTLDQAKSEFLFIASHELRTPMTSIKGSLGLLRSGITGELQPSGLALIEIAEKETDRLIRLINDLLDLAKIESASMEFEKKWLPAHQLLQKTLLTLEGLSQTAGVPLRLEMQEGAEEALALMDGDRMQQVFNNLISNALKFSPPGKPVTVRLSAAPERGLRVDVVDQGPGIDPEAQELIFEKFSQALGSKSHLVAGTGLGLAIAKAIVSEHEGQISVKSRPGRGATFSVTLKHWKWADVEALAPATKAQVLCIPKTASTLPGASSPQAPGQLASVPSEPAGDNLAASLQDESKGAAA